MNELDAATKEITGFMQQRGWRYCIVGGLAVPVWGEARSTSDVDLCLFTGLGSERDFIEPLLKQFAPRIESAAEFAEANRVVLLNSANQIGIDIALGWSPFEDRMLARAVNYQFQPDLAALVATAEDLIVMKAFAGRPLDWVDVNRIIVRQRAGLDWDYIRRQLSQLCELRESFEPLEELERLRQQATPE